MSELKNIVSCWHKLEHFSPAALPNDNNIQELQNKLPWEIPVKSRDKNKTIEYTIYLGVFNSSYVIDFVKTYFNDKSEEVNSRSNLICYASLKIDIEGKCLNDSIGISTLPWALSQLENNKVNNDNWSMDFNSKKEELLNELEYNLNKKLDYSDISEIEKKIISMCGWSIFPTFKTYIKTEEKYISVKKIDTNKSQSELLNSFFINDLEKILSNFKESNIPEAFLSYLKGCLNYKTERVDLSKDNDILKSTLRPDVYPDGCWPSQYTLSLMQQYAVNVLFQNLSGENQRGMYSVNGPPGSGKTTLLRDVIAAIIVKRAKGLAKISKPHEAFSKIGEIKINDTYSPSIYALEKSLCHGGIVIASSNNGAVENISMELPLKKEVSPYEDDISYFREVAESCIKQDNWGIIAAVLGNKENRNNLVNSLWFNNSEESTDLKNTLKDKRSNIEEWNFVVSDFNKKLKKVQTEKNKLNNFISEYNNYEESKIQKQNLEITLQKLINEHTILKEEIQCLIEQVKGITDRKDKFLYELKTIQKSKPGFFIYWLNKSIRKQFNQTILQGYNAYNQATISYHETNVLLNIKVDIEYKLKVKINQTENLYNQIVTKFIKLEKATNESKKIMNGNYADIDFWKKIETKESQESCPWYSKTLKQFQSQLFISALKLNELFILNANAHSSRISSSLAAFFEYLKGNTPVSKVEAKAMWDMFFLITPVVSTTFASVQTMFNDLGKEDIPWLFIDEAGQAVPQAAAGAIWRSQRVGVVGDPLQIEPVVTIQEAITNNFSGYFNLNKTNISSELSVQTMADRINPLGTYLDSGDSNIWIGIPLRIHRRCINPMFDIANKIAYNNTMFLSTKTPLEISVNFVTSFINQKGLVKGRHWVEEHGLIIQNLLISEINYCKSFPDVFVITPFTEIRYQLKRMLFNSILNGMKKFNKEVNSEDIGNWLDTHVGTIHTFQGKQADGVILCLGLDEKTKGAATWASSKPNLLNVALTRAKYRFIAIGDETIWLNQPYFKELKKLN